MLPFSLLKRVTLKHKIIGKQKEKKMWGYLLKRCFWNDHKPASKKINKFEHILKTNPKIYMQVLSPMSQVCQLSGQDPSLITQLVLIAHRASVVCGSIKKPQLVKICSKSRG